MSDFQFEYDKKKIKQFLELLERKIDFERYNKPILSYKTDDDFVYYTVWEEEILEKLGVGNISGYDYRDPVFFCPDWITDEGLDDDEDFDDDDDFLDDLDDLENL